MARTTDDIAEELVCAYEWHPFPAVKPDLDDVGSWFALSVPADKKQPRTIGMWSGNNFMPAQGQAIAGVTYWAELPATPEDQQRDAGPNLGNEADRTGDLFQEEKR